MASRKCSYNYTAVENSQWWKTTITPWATKQHYRVHIIIWSVCVCMCTGRGFTLMCSYSVCRGLWVPTLRKRSIWYLLNSAHSTTSGTGSEGRGEGSWRHWTSSSTKLSSTVTTRSSSLAPKATEGPSESEGVSLVVCSLGIYHMFCQFHSHKNACVFHF